MSKVIGIDISKKTFDVAFLNQEDKWQHFEFENSFKGIKLFIKKIKQTDHCVMEASGPYYMQLAYMLSEKQILVSVVNPLVIRRYAQMKLIRAKTDKKDAQVIAQYGQQEKPKKWLAKASVIIGMRQMVTAMRLITKQIGMIRNQLGSLEATGMPDKATIKSLQAIEKTLLKQQLNLDTNLTNAAKKDYEQTVARLQTIPGIGKKAAIMLTLLTEDFTRFENYKQLIAYVGFSPRVYQSGTSVRGKGHICKMGNSQIRKILYMCSWSAKKYNRACVTMYQRLKAKGKPERVIKIALANKLIKQVFAIAKNKTNYEENYMPKPCF